jgi:hypothetical protein
MQKIAEKVELGGVGDGEDWRMGSRGGGCKQANLAARLLMPPTSPVEL